MKGHIKLTGGTRVWNP